MFFYMHHREKSQFTANYFKIVTRYIYNELSEKSHGDKVYLQ